MYNAGNVVGEAILEHSDCDKLNAIKPYHPHQNLEETTLLESMLNDNNKISKNPSRNYTLEGITYENGLTPSVSKIPSRTFYVTPYGEAHLRMPTEDYIRNEEKRLWNWYTPKITPYILLLYIPIKELSKLC